MLAAPAPLPARRERRKREVRDRILEAAVALADSRGFAGTKVADICERADVVTKTFFNHFPSKQHLLREIAERQLATLCDDIRAVRERPGTTRQRLVWFFERITESVETAGPMRRELVTETIHATYDSGAETQRSRQLHEAFGGIVRDGRRAGDVLEGHSVTAQTELVLGTFYALMLRWAHDPRYALRRHALAAARLLGDALCGPSGGRKT
jgi:AcrR family transcriptional regulator